MIFQTAVQQNMGVLDHPSAVKHGRRCNDPGGLFAFSWLDDF
jgi:hypothetical protein